MNFRVFTCLFYDIDACVLHSPTSQIDDIDDEPL